jgi:hypothetical protein
MAKADTTCTTSDARLEQLEAPICAAIDMAEVAVIVFNHASIAATSDGAFLKVNRQAWNSLGFLLQHQRELAKAVLVAYEAGVDVEDGS